jgi:hypothetical protein
MGGRTAIKNIIDQTPLYGIVQSWVEKNKQKKELLQWEKDGRPVPPPAAIKHQNLLYYARKYNLKILVETGTYLGETIEAMADHFNHIYSIELSNALYKKAKRRFKNRSNIELIHGDSAKELEKIMKEIDQPTIFWLDGHYSDGITARGDKDTPIYEELQHIFKAKDLKHIIFIDDARCFGTDSAYPSLDEIIHFIKTHKENVNISVKHDSIVITPC